KCPRPQRLLTYPSIANLSNLFTDFYPHPPIDYRPHHRPPLRPCPSPCQCPDHKIGPMGRPIAPITKALPMPSARHRAAGSGPMGHPDHAPKLPHLRPPHVHRHRAHPWGEPPRSSPLKNLEPFP
ncbi:hypothetical protein L3556_02715, partial [Candidatus Synechococcus calcipolaris G9]